VNKEKKQFILWRRWSWMTGTCHDLGFSVHLWQNSYTQTYELGDRGRQQPSRNRPSIARSNNETASRWVQAHPMEPRVKGIWSAASLRRIAALALTAVMKEKLQQSWSAWQWTRTVDMWVIAVQLQWDNPNDDKHSLCAKPINLFISIWWNAQSMTTDFREGEFKRSNWSTHVLIAN
jgi:hypothetical protein